MAISTRVGGSVGTPTPIPTNTPTSSPAPTPSPIPTFSSEVTWGSESDLNDSNIDFSSNPNTYGGQANTTWNEKTVHSTENSRYFDASTDVYTYENDDYFDASAGVPTTENASYLSTSTENFYSSNVDDVTDSAHALSRDYNPTGLNEADSRRGYPGDTGVDSRVNEYDSSTDSFDSSSSDWDSSSDDDFSVDSDSDVRNFDSQGIYSNEVLSRNTINNMLASPLTYVDEYALNMPMDNIHATQLDNMVTSPSKRDPEQIREQINTVYDNTGGLMSRHPPSLDMVTFIPRPSQEELAQRRETAANFDFDNLGDAHRLEVTTKYSIDKNQDRRLTMQYSVRNATQGQLPYASDANLAHLQAASETFEGVRQGEQPRMPNILERETVSGSQAVKLIGDIYTKYNSEGSNQAPVTLGINHGFFDAESLEQAQDLKEILTSSVNGKSTLNMIRDYNTLYGTDYAIVGVTITMGDEKSSSLPGYSLPNLAFHVSDHTNQEP